MAGVESGVLPEHRQSKLDKQKVREAVAALLAYHKKFAQNQKKELLLNEASVIQLQLAVWKITGEKARTIQIKLPHPLRSENTEACLFTKDLTGKSSEECIDHFNELLKEKGVTGVGEVIPLKTYRTEYKQYIARRQLAGKYDIFLADDRIFRLMHSHIGKEFYKKKKYPICVSLTKQDLKTEIEDAINASYFILSNRGDCNHFKVGRTDMTADQVVENIMTGVQSMVEHITNGWPNVKALSVKTERSISLPIYSSLVYEDWAQDIMVDNTDLVKLKKLVLSEEPGNEAEQEPSSKTKTKPPIKQAKTKPELAKPNLTKRRLSGRGLKKLRLKTKRDKQAKKATSSSTAPQNVLSIKSGEQNKKLGKLNRNEAMKGKGKRAVKAEGSVKTAKAASGKKVVASRISQPIKAVGGKRKSEGKRTPKEATSAKKSKRVVTSN